MASDQNGYWQGMYRGPDGQQPNGTYQQVQARSNGGFDGASPDAARGYAGDSNQRQSDFQQEYQQEYQQGYQQSGARNGQSYQQSPSYRQQYHPGAVRKDHIAAALLAIFLGSLGIHKFYLGYNQAGFIMLAVTVLGSIVTLGIALLVMEVISLIEGIIYLTKSQQEFDQIYVNHKREWF